MWDEKMESIMGKEPWPENIGETKQGHPPEDWDGVLDEVDPNSGLVPYPDDMPEPSGWPDDEEPLPPRDDE